MNSFINWLIGGGVLSIATIAGLFLRLTYRKVYADNKLRSDMQADIAKLYDKISLHTDEIYKLKGQLILKDAEIASLKLQLDELVKLKGLKGDVWELIHVLEYGTTKDWDNARVRGLEIKARLKHETA